MCMFCRSLFAIFLLAIVFSCRLRFTDSDYPFGIVKLFVLQTSMKSYERCNLTTLIELGQTIQWPKEKGQAMLYKTLDRKLQIE